jgi:hypothetical protein
MVPIKISYQSHEIQGWIGSKEKQLCIIIIIIITFILVILIFHGT